MAKIVRTSAAAPLLAAEAPVEGRDYYELRYYQLRSGYSKKALPAKPALAGKRKLGAFNPVIGENSPYLLLLLTYDSFAEAENAPELEFDYLRCERTLLRSFLGMPRLRLPPESKAGHVFELRTYESNNMTTLRKKIDMFHAGEMAIFKRLGMNPVFFGEALIGSRLPHLTYMLAFEDLAARDRLWKDFSADPEWQKMRIKPGLSDAEIVSNISNVILRPASISDIR